MTPDHWRNPVVRLLWRTQAPLPKLRRRRSCSSTRAVVADDFRRRLAEDETRARRVAEEGDESGGVPGEDRRPLSTNPNPNPNPKLKRFLSSAFENAPPEKRYKAKRRAVDVLCAAAKPAAGATGGADVDPEARASHLRVARRSLAATARVMRGAAAFAALKSGALPNALALMAAAPKDRNAQISGCRVIAACVADAALSTHAKRSPSFAGGGALRAAAAALRRHGAEDASAARAAARAMWTAVHLGGRAAQEEMFRSDGAHTVPPLLAAMRAHAEDASVTEACCGCLLASALGFGPGRDALAASGARAAIEDALEASRPDIVFYNAGVDVHREDRLGLLDITDEGLARRERMVCDAVMRRGLPIVGVLGGGYTHDLDALARRHTMMHAALAEGLRRFA